MAQIVRVSTACIPKTSYGAVRQEKEIILCHIKLDQCEKKIFFSSSHMFHDSINVNFFCR